VIQDRSRAVCPTCGRCGDPSGIMLEAGALLGLLVDAGVVTVDHSEGIVELTAGARALDGDALDSLIAELGRGDLTPAGLRAIVERGAPN